MSFDDSVQSLATSLKKFVLTNVHGQDSARSMLAQHKNSSNSRVANLAEEFYENSDTYGITNVLLQVGTHYGTKLSALRSAIVLVLEEHLGVRGASSSLAGATA